MLLRQDAWTKHAVQTVELSQTGTRLERENGFCTCSASHGCLKIREDMYRGEGGCRWYFQWSPTLIWKESVTFG